jgi:lambda family phage portal protein
MNWLDRAVSLVAPRAGLRRAQSRLAHELVDGYTARHAERFGYDGASPGRRASGWFASSSDANVELMGSLVWLRNRSRELVRNNPYAARAIEELAANVVGTGIVPQSKTGDDALDKIIDGEWPYFADNCDTPQRLDFYAMQALVMRTTAESGESIARFRPRLAKDNLRVPLQLQLLEADFLDQTKTMGTVNGHVMQGVEFDLLGRRVAYWLYTYHPGGVLILNPRGGILSQPIPANQVLHNYRQLRPGQVRGIPWLHPVMLALRDLEDYADAERVRKKIEACIAAFVIQPEGIDGSWLGVSGTDPSAPAPIESFQPGMVSYLKPGEDVKFSDPKPTGDYRAYKTVELQGIAAGLGIPYEILSGDLSLVNYSSWRGGQLGFRNTIEGYRWLTLIPMFCMPVRRRVIDTLVMLGKIPARAVTDPTINLYGTQWTAPRFESVDPVKDAEAVLKDIRMGRTTWFDAVLAAGYDPQAQLKQIALFNKLVDKLEIILDCDPRNTTLRGQEQPANTEERTPGSKAVPVGKPAGGGVNNSAQMSDEDYGMLKELLTSLHQGNRGGALETSNTRFYA